MDEVAWEVQPLVVVPTGTLTSRMGFLGILYPQILNDIVDVTHHLLKRHLSRGR